MFNNALLIDLDEAGVIREACMPQEEANWWFDCKLAKGEPASLIQLDVDADIAFVRIVSPTLESRISRARARVSEQGELITAAGALLRAGANHAL